MGGADGRLRRRARVALLGPVAVVLAVLSPAARAEAHPLDVYLQASYLTVAPSAVVVELDLSPGVLVAPRVLPQLDADDDHDITAAEARRYVAGALAAVELVVDGRPRALRITKVEIPPYLTVRAGYGTLRVFATAADAPGSLGRHTVTFGNGSNDPKAKFQVNAFTARDEPVQLGAQHRDDTQRRTAFTYRITGARPNHAAVRAAEHADTAAAGSTLADFLQSKSLAWSAVLLALGAAVLLGALHALTPGHAKTLIAAYLVGNGGRARDAVTLGAVVTITHTASVILIGVVALFASRFLLPDVLVPGLELLAGLLVLGIGVRLLRQRWRHRAANRHRAPERVLAGVAHPHSHGGREHTHALPADGPSRPGLVAMGVSGGIVPCPEALGVMILAVGVNRTVFGLGLIVAFSIGLALVLIGLGLLLVQSRAVAERFAGLGTRHADTLALLSAVVVTGLGAGLLVGAIT